MKFFVPAPWNNSRKLDHTSLCSFSSRILTLNILVIVLLLLFIIVIEKNEGVISYARCSKENVRPHFIVYRQSINLSFSLIICSKHIKFGILTPQEIVEMAEIEVVNRELYNVTNRTPIKYGCLDRRLVRRGYNRSLNPNRLLGYF